MIHIESLVEVNILFHRIWKQPAIQAVSFHINLFSQQLSIPATRIHVSHVLSRLLEKVNKQSDILIYILRPYILFIALSNLIWIILV